jgi:hypothetical protein
VFGGTVTAIGALAATITERTVTLLPGKKAVVRLDCADITTVPAKPLILAKRNCVCPDEPITILSAVSDWKQNDGGELANTYDMSSQ